MFSFRFWMFALSLRIPASVFPAVLLSCPVQLLSATAQVLAGLDLTLFRVGAGAGLDDLRTRVFDLHCTFPPFQGSVITAERPPRVIEIHRTFQSSSKAFPVYGEGVAA